MRRPTQAATRRTHPTTQAQRGTKDEPAPAPSATVPNRRPKPTDDMTPR